MPKVYRSMFEHAGAPRTGGDTCELGVRPPGHPVAADVHVYSSGNVAMDGGGMSVFPSIIPADLKRIPKRLVPLRLANKVPGAAGDNDMKIWTTGAGAFVSGPMRGALVLNVTGRSHGTMCPAHAMSLNALQTELARTQLDWTIEEP